MERLRFRRKAGRGTHRFSEGGFKYTVNSGDVVTVSREALGTSIDGYDCLDGPLVPEQPEKLVARSPEIVPDEARGWYNVVNPDHPDRPLNDRRLRKKDAEELLASLADKAEEE